MSSAVDADGDAAAATAAVSPAGAGQARKTWDTASTASAPSSQGTGEADGSGAGAAGAGAEAKSSLALDQDNDGASSMAGAAAAGAGEGSLAGGFSDSLVSSNKKKVTVKVGMVGDSQIGKTSLMVKYVEGSFNDDYVQTLGVNFMQKTIQLKNTDITFTIWDLGGQKEYLHMMPLVCNDAIALLFMFDLSRKSTLTSVKNWYKQARLLNKTAPPFLVGTKYDVFMTMKEEDKEEITTQARRFAKAMKAPLIFCSAAASVNIHKIFKIVLSKAFDLKCNVDKIEKMGDPIIEY